jgi:hypothetical protein
VAGGCGVDGDVDAAGCGFVDEAGAGDCGLGGEVEPGGCAVDGCGFGVGGDVFCGGGVAVEAGGGPIVT